MRHTTSFAGAAALLTSAMIVLAACGSAAPAASTAPSAAPATSKAASTSAAASASTSAAPSSTVPSAKASLAGSAASTAASTSARAVASAPASGMIALKSAYTTTSGSVAPLWVAKDSGYFAQQGLNVSLALVHAGAPILAALTSQNVPIAFAGGQEIVNADMKGADLVIVAGFSDHLTDSIYTAKNITTPAQLKGGALGVTGFGAISQIAAEFGLAKLGLTGQVHFVATGGPPATLAAIQAGKVQGGVFSPPQTFKAASLGLHQLIDISTINAPVQTTVVATSRAYAKAHPDVVRRYLTAMLEAAHRAVTDKQVGSAAIAKYAGIKDAAVVSKTYDYFQNKIGHDGFPSIAGIQGNIKIAQQQGNPKAKSFKPAQFIDTSFVTKIKDSGLLTKLWGKP